MFNFPTKILHGFGELRVERVSYGFNGRLFVENAGAEGAIRFGQAFDGGVGGTIV